MIDLDQKVRELRALAKKATPGPRWAATSGEQDLSVLAEVGGWLVLARCEDHDWEYEGRSRDDAAYIAAANPAALLAILDEFDRRGAALVEAEGANRLGAVERAIAAQPGVRLCIARGHINMAQISNAVLAAIAQEAGK
jgi:hypothetical protein